MESRGASGEEGRLIERLARLFPEASGRSLKQWLEKGRVRLNGEVVRDGRTPLAAGDEVALTRHGPAPFPAGLRLVHEDEDLLVVDKPAGLLTIATERERVRTAYRMVWDYLAASRPPRRPFVVHRLDRETSGLVVFAKSPAAKQALQAQFESRAAERVYVALVEGVVAAEDGVLRSRLVQDRSLRVRAAPAGKEAVTRFRVLRRRGERTLLEVALETGRRRQIRVQLAELGHPIVGDAAHGGRASRRLCLHATRLAFIHPRTRAPVSFRSAAPRDWA